MNASRVPFLLVLVLAVCPRGAGGQETVLVEMGSAMRWRIPSDASLGLSWTTREYEDTAWNAGTYGVGYAAGAMIRTTVPTTTQAVYTRTRFTIPDLPAVESVWLGVDYDDGFVAWINGEEVARSGSMPAGEPDFDSEAGNRESSNGATPNYDPILDITTRALPRLLGGENVLAIGIWNTALPSTDMALVPRLSVNRPPPVSQEIHWTAAGSPYTLTTTLQVGRGTVLRIDPGVTVRAAAGVGIEVQGQILAEGSQAAPIVFDRSGTTGSWGGIDIDHGGDGVIRRSAIRHAVLRNASTLIDVEATGDSEVLIEDCQLDSWGSVAFHWDNGANGLHINRCRVGMNTPVAEQSHEAVNGYRSNALLENCIFGPRRGYNDTIDLGSTKWGGPVPTVRYNTILPGEDDGIDFDNCDGYIIGNFVYGRRPPASGPKEDDCPQYPVAGSGTNGGGITGNEGSRPVVMNNIVYNCFHGIGYKNAADPLLINNTVVGCTWGIILFETSDIANPEVAHGTLVNNLIWDCQVPLRLRWCDSGPVSTVDVRNSIVPGGWPGEGNLSPAVAPVALPADPLNPTREDFRLLRCSPAIDAGFAGAVARPFHSEPVPTLDALGGARQDLLSVADQGVGEASYYDIGALESGGPDDCGTTPPGHFLRGDANGDGALDLSDPVAALFTLFAGRPTDCEDALDSNDDGILGVADAIRTLALLFRNGEPLPAPYPAAGADPTLTDDPLGCSRS